MKVYVNVMSAKGNNPVVVCDEELIGKTFGEGEKILDLKESYFKGKLIDVNDLDDYFKPGILQVVGKNAIDYLILKKILSKDEVAYIANIPYVNIIFEK